MLASDLGDSENEERRGEAPALVASSFKLNQDQDVKAP